MFQYVRVGLQRDVETQDSTKKAVDLPLYVCYNGSDIGLQRSRCMPSLPDNFEALLLDPETRHVTMRGMVTRQMLLRLAMKGLNATKAARAAGLNPYTVRAIYRDPNFRKEVYGRVDGAFDEVDKAFHETKKSLHECLAEEAEHAFETLRDMLADQQTMPSLKVKIAQDFLDRNPETQPGHTVTRFSMQMQSEELAHAARIAKEMDSGVITLMPRVPQREIGTK
jgi:hypothetical protein